MSNNSEGNKDAKREVMREYSTDDVIVYWRPSECSHSAKCLNNLPKVFNLNKKPWISLSSATPEEIIKTIDLCPTNALQYKVPPGSKVDSSLAKGPGSVDYKVEATEFIQIKMVNNGPLIVKGSAQVLDPQGKLIKESNHLVLCACGRSENKPFCDGAHARKE